MKVITKEWIDLASDDLAVIENIIEVDYLTNMVAYHSQQAIEKCFKALCEEFELKFLKVHDLEHLYWHIKKHLNFDIEIQLIKKLDKLYTDSRYPSSFGLLPFGKPSKEDAIVFYNFAKYIYNNVTAQLA